jgi:hypothetical protein
VAWTLKSLNHNGYFGAIVMMLIGSRIVAVVVGSASVLLLGAGPGWAGMPVPAPLVGVTGPYGIAAAGIVYGGYWLFRRYRNRS